ncbi:protein-L-isoaspartate(D-aspartate) O-methyltransferase [Halobaculum sp. P14]|uniref:protein-L-isoaspartate(D-aspartate) O-methyltransferase n=1 Tax=Halobaculum sp. P14 TaxID=3421638 RepID=UPI003EBDB4FE
MDFAEARENMVDRLARGSSVDDDVAEALRTVPRHEFVPDDRREDAYKDRPLPIGGGQTVSAPHMVAEMCAVLDPEAGDEVLEVGTGSGYHAAITAELVGDDGAVYTVEYDETLAAEARETLDRLGYDDVAVRCGDGRDGWPEKAPFDRAYLTCAVPEFPPPILDQLRTGGVALAPVGTLRQQLVFARVDDTGEIADCEHHGPVQFVRVRGADGADEDDGAG